MLKKQNNTKKQI